MEPLLTPDNVRWVFSNLVGVGFGAVIFWFYRKDVMQREEKLSRLVESAVAIIAEVKTVLIEVKRVIERK